MKRRRQRWDEGIKLETHPVFRELDQYELFSLLHKRNVYWERQQKELEDTYYA